MPTVIRLGCLLAVIACIIGGERHRGWKTPGLAASQSFEHEAWEGWQDFGIGPVGL
jgi:hypothetical protein